MQNYTIKHGLRKNLPIGTIYNSQVAAIIFTIGLGFKLSSAPGLMSEKFGSSTFWIFAFFTLIEGFCTICIFCFARINADGVLRATSSKCYKLVCLFASLWLTAKTVFYFCYSVSYLTHELFTGVQPHLVYLLFLLPVIYLGVKGTKAIARSCELFSILFFAVVILNLAFLDADIDVGRNLPILSHDIGYYAKTMPKFGLWLGDLFPFVFTRIRNKKAPYITLGIATTWTLANIVVFLGVALYGNALKAVSDLLIHIASFNQLTLEIGRMEWTNLLAMLMMSLYSLAFLFDGANNACQRALGTSLPSKLACPVILVCVSLFVASTQAVTKFALGWAGYVLSAMSFSLPVICFVLGMIAKKRYKGIYRALDEEYLPNTPLPTKPDSQNNDILSGFENRANKGVSQ